MLPLEGLIVVSVEQAVAAPFCSSRLALSSNIASQSVFSMRSLYVVTYPSAIR
jgi:hypothetical protein